MGKKNKSDARGFVYSTDPDFRFEEESEAAETLEPARQQLRVSLETKHRAGKSVTVVSGFVGTKEDLETMCKQLKNLCGCGGSVKEGEVLIQGDHRPRIIDWLIRQGYKQTKQKGG